jgi:hypothetical protein
MISDDGVIRSEEFTDSFYNEVVGWAHQCWQLHVLGNDIDLIEFKRRMNVENIDYQKFMTDFAFKLEESPDADKIYMQRVMHVLYPETYTNPDI